MLSFTIVGEMFPQHLVGRANGALNVCHLGTAFLMQTGMGAIVSGWPAQADGHPPVIAYCAAFGAIVAVQATALLWFGVAGRGLGGPQPADDGLPGHALASWPNPSRVERRAVRRSLWIAAVLACVLGGIAAYGVMTR